MNRDYSRWLIGNNTIIAYCIIITGISYFLEYELGLLPCVLCLAERYLIILILLIAIFNLFLSGINNKWPKFFGSSSILLFSITGLAISIRHFSLGFVPQNSEIIYSCSASLEQLLKNMQLTEVFNTLFVEASDCGRESFKLLGLSLPFWSLLSFALLTLVSIYCCLASMWANPLAMILRTYRGTNIN